MVCVDMGVGVCYSRRQGGYFGLLECIGRWVWELGTAFKGSRSVLEGLLGC